MRIKYNQDLKHEPVQAKNLEVNLDEVGGDTTKLIKKFGKKVRKEEVLLPYYDRLMFYSTKSQKRRKKRLKAIFAQKKENAERLLLDKDLK
jgi:truncated hemoglobin YjbI